MVIKVGGIMIGAVMIDADCHMCGIHADVQTGLVSLTWPYLTEIGTN